MCEIHETQPKMASRLASRKPDDDEKHMKCSYCKTAGHDKTMAICLFPCHHNLCYKCFERMIEVTQLRHCIQCQEHVKTVLRCQPDKVYSCRWETCFASFSSTWRRDAHERSCAQRHKDRRRQEDAPRSKDDERSPRVLVSTNRQTGRTLTITRR